LIRLNAKYLLWAVYKRHKINVTIKFFIAWSE
jgi:hypothetical protein